MNAAARRRVRTSSPLSPICSPTRRGCRKGSAITPDVLSADEEEALARELAALPFKPFDFHGYLANRQVVSFGYRYDYDRRPWSRRRRFRTFFTPLRRKVAALFDRPGGLLPPGPHQRIPARRRNRLASGQGAVRRGRWRLAACALLAALPPEGGRGLGARVAHGRAALGLSPLGAGPRGLGSTAFRPSTGFVIRSPCGRSTVARLSRGFLPVGRDDRAAR